MHERRSTLQLLTGHFFRRFFDNDTIQVDGDTQTTVARAMAIVASPSLTIAFFLQNAYPARTFWYRIEDHYTMILITYVVMGLATVLEWEMLFPDRLDFLVLSPLPIRPWQMLAAKAGALLAFVTLFLVGSSVLGDFVLPAVSKSGLRLQMPAQVVAVSMAGIFAGCSFVALAGVLLCVLGASLFRVVSPVLQALAIGWLVLLGIHFLVYGSSIPALLSPPLRAARWIPPLWFLGVYERLYHGAGAAQFALEMSHMAVWGTVTAIVTAVVTYPLAWRRMRRAALEGSSRGQSAPSRRIGAWLGAWLGRLVPRPGERAVFHFVGKTISRHSRYQVYLAVYCGAALALALACAVVVRSEGSGVRLAVSPWGLHAVLPLLIFWTIAGLRVAFGIPANLQAGWIFRVTGVDLGECAAAARKWAVLCATGILVVVLLILAALGWDLRQLAVQLLCGSGLALLLADLFFASETRVPFNSPRMPGRVSFPLMLTLYLGVLPIFLVGMLHLEIALEHGLIRAALVAVAAAAAHLLLVRLREGGGVTGSPPDEDDGEFQLLGLSDG